MKILLLLVLLLVGCTPENVKRGDTAAEAWCELHKGVLMWTTSIIVSERDGRHRERLTEIHVTCVDGHQFDAKYPL